MNEFCECLNPNFEVFQTAVQSGGEIRDEVLGEFCTECGNAKPPREVETE